VVQPARDEAAAAVARHDARRFRIDVLARLPVVVEPREDDRQRALAAAIEIVAIVVIDHVDTSEPGRRRRLRHQIDQRLVIECSPRRAVESARPACRRLQSSRGTPSPADVDELEILDGESRELRDCVSRTLALEVVQSQRRTERLPDVGHAAAVGVPARRLRKRIH
jgi:hypothetical protein